MNQLTFGNASDELVLALTHGPIPGGIQAWEVEESSYDDHGASAILKVNGRSFLIRVTQIADGE